MRIDKKEIQKEDGRYLLFYHFSETASESQRAAFIAVPGETTPLATDTDHTDAPGAKDDARV